MKKLGYEHQGPSTYLTYELEPEDVVDSMSLGMLMNNRIPGFVPTVFTQIDHIKQIKYDVTARVPADQYLLGTVNRKRLLGVFRGIMQAYLSAEDYMIAPESIQLSLDSIFANVVSGETALICMPIVKDSKNGPIDIKEFLKEILFSAQYDEREDQSYVAKLMSYLNGVPVFSAKEFMDLLDYIAKDAVNQVESAKRMEVAATEPHEERPISAPEPLQPILPHPEEKTVQPKAEENNPAQQISLFYLLQHYNKENAAAYKAQKEKKKQEKKDLAEEKGRKREAKQTAVPSQNFAVPGQKEDASEEKSEPALVGGISASIPDKPVQPIQPIRPIPKIQSVSPVQKPEQVRRQEMNLEVPCAPSESAARQYTPSFPEKGILTSEDMSTVYFCEENQDETVLLGQEVPARRLIPFLLRKRTQEKISVAKPVFRIGRDADYNDYVIPENRYIGHSHCHILSRDGEYFLMDDNSKNRTRVNGEVIPAGVEIKIAHGYVIKIADEEFEFRLY